MDQAHLTPLPQNIRPVLWDFDHALRLYPAPTTVRSLVNSPPFCDLIAKNNRTTPQLILADKFDPYKHVYEGCLVFNPGSFASSRFRWSTYMPGMEEPNLRMDERCVFNFSRAVCNWFTVILFCQCCPLNVDSELPGPDDV